MTVGIYRITNNVNGKLYFGQSLNVEKRLREHKRNEKHNDHLTNSINKYGVENFTFELEISTTIPYLNRLEKLFIRKYDTTNREKGYNKDSGGRANYIMSDESKRKMIESKTKNYARIINNGYSHGKRQYCIKYNKKIVKSSVDVHKLINWWNETHPTEPIHVEVNNK